MACDYCEGVGEVYEIGLTVVVPESAIYEASTRVAQEVGGRIARAEQYYGQKIRRRRCPRCRGKAVPSHRCGLKQGS